MTRKQSTKDKVLMCLEENPHISDEEILEQLRANDPACTTTIASIRSMKSNLKKDGLWTPADVAPSFVATGGRYTPADPDETSEERSERISRRYATLERQANSVVNHGLPCLIVSGPPGLGKSYTVERTLENNAVVNAATIDQEELDLINQNPHGRLDEDGTTVIQNQKMYDCISGSVSGPGLYITLWNMRNGGIVLLDDCDDVFRDETCLNILKAVLDSSEKRIVSWRKLARWLEEMGIPNSFEFKGSVVFCTNIDFESEIARGSKLATHFSALMDRSLYLSLSMRSKEDYLTRLHQVGVEQGMLKSTGLNDTQIQEVMDFVEENQDNFYSLSLRLLHQMALLRAADDEFWKDDILATKIRNTK